MAWDPDKGFVADDAQPVIDSERSEDGSGGEPFSLDGGGSSGGGSGSDSGTGGGGDYTTALGSSVVGSDDGFARDAKGNRIRNKDGSYRKRRGRRAGSGGSKQAGKQKVPVASLARFLAFSHGAIAGITKTPEVKINDNESVMLATPLSEILAMYDVEIDPRVMLWTEFIAACSYVYGPRFYLIQERMKEEAKARNAKKVGEGQGRPVNRGESSPRTGYGGLGIHPGQGGSADVRPTSQQSNAMKLGPDASPEQIDAFFALNPDAGNT